jgi:hypothetical protein
MLRETAHTHASIPTAGLQAHRSGSATRVMIRQLLSVGLTLREKRDNLELFDAMLMVEMGATDTTTAVVRGKSPKASPP